MQADPLHPPQPLPPRGRGGRRRRPARLRERVWLLDLDDTLHDASGAAFPHLHVAMGDYIARHLSLGPDDAAALRRRYWLRYGATLLGLVRHHGVKPAHFLEETHRIPDLEQRLQASAHDRAALRRLPGRKVLVTNAPRAYADRVMRHLGFADAFDRIVSVEDMTMFGHLRPKPDARMFRHLAVRLGVPTDRCTLVDDTLQHLKSARSVGMRTVWMRRWQPRFRAGRPPYVCARIAALRTLLRSR